MTRRANVRGRPSRSRKPRRRPADISGWVVDDDELAWRKACDADPEDGLVRLDTTKGALSMSEGYRRLIVEIYELFDSTPDYPYWRAVVTTTRGLCYSCVFAGDKPAEEHVLRAWRDDRRAFDPHYS